MKKVLRNIKLIYWLIKKLEEKYPGQQIGKTKIQKLMYLLEDSLNEDFGYTMYHYGPYSNEIAESLNVANIIGWLDMEWHVGEGYYISLKNPSSISEIQPDEETKINEVVEKYGHFTALELSIITTAVYVKKNFDVNDPNEIIDIVLSLKPNNKKEWIKDILERAGVI